MVFSLNQHSGDCAPLSPCRHCQIGVFLRNKLSPDDYQEFMKICNTTNDVLKKRIVDVFPELSGRTKNILHNEQIVTLEQLLRHTREELARIPNCGRRSLDEIIENLNTIGRRLGEVPKKPDN